MSHPLRTIHTQALDFWFARSSVVLIVALQVLVINKLSLGPRWLAPALEVALLAPLSFVTAWTQSQAREATTDHHWATVARRRRIIRGMAVALTILVTVMNFASLLYLVKALLGGHSGNSGQTLLLDALNIWATNVIAFALWFWNIDRGGPASQGLTPSRQGRLPVPADDHPPMRGMVSRVHRLSVHILHQCHGVLADGHHAAVEARQGTDGGRGRHIPADHRAGGGKGGEHPRVS